MQVWGESLNTKINILINALQDEYYKNGHDKKCQSSFNYVFY